MVYHISCRCRKAILCVCVLQLLKEFFLWELKKIDGSERINEQFKLSEMAYDGT